VAVPTNLSGNDLTAFVKELKSAGLEVKADDKGKIQVTLHTTADADAAGFILGSLYGEAVAKAVHDSAASNRGTGAEGGAALDRGRIYGLLGNTEGSSNFVRRGDPLIDPAKWAAEIDDVARKTAEINKGRACVDPVTCATQDGMMHYAQEASVAALIQLGVGTMARGTTVVPPDPAPTVPQHATDVLSQVRQSGTAPPGFRGGRTYANDGRGAGQVLPTADGEGNPIKYREWDVKPYQRV